MDAIEALVAQVQGLSSNREDLNALQAHLAQSTECLESQSTQLLHFLEQLDPFRHSLGYLYLLDAYASSSVSKEHPGEIVLPVVKFIVSCNADQIRLASEKFVSLCKRLKDLVIYLHVPLRGIMPLRIGIRKVQPSSEHLTALHADFLLLCLLSKCYKAATNILKDHIVEIDQPRDFFLHCYYGGMVNIGLKRFPEALECLHNVVTAPLLSLNAIAIEAYKKYILVSLIHNGQLHSFPKYTSSVVQRSLKGHVQPYIELSNSYSTGRMSELEACLEANFEQYRIDNNVGLVKQVLSSLSRRNIQRLTQTYLTLSLQDIASSVQLDNSKKAEMHVLEMIRGAEIFASINQKDGMVSFNEDPEQYKTCEMITNIDASIRRIMSLRNKLREIDERLACDPIYLSKVGRERSRFDIDDFEPVHPKLL